MCNLYSITRSQDAMRRLFAISAAGRSAEAATALPDHELQIVANGALDFSSV
jgi:hypothetical protein